MITITKTKAGEIISEAIRISDRMCKDYGYEKQLLMLAEEASNIAYTINQHLRIVKEKKEKGETDVHHLAPYFRGEMENKIAAVLVLALGIMGIDGFFRQLTTITKWIDRNYCKHNEDEQYAERRWAMKDSLVIRQDLKCQIRAIQELIALLHGKITNSPISPQDVFGLQLIQGDLKTAISALEAAASRLDSIRFESDGKEVSDE